MTCSATRRNNNRTAWKKSTQVAELLFYLQQQHPTTTKPKMSKEVAEWLFYLQQQHITTTKPKMSIEVAEWLEFNSSSKQLALRQLGKISMEVDSKDMIVNQNNSKNTERNGRWKPGYVLLAFFETQLVETPRRTTHTRTTRRTQLIEKKFDEIDGEERKRWRR